MSRANRALIVLVITSLGLWGCAQGSTNGPVSAERVRNLEAKIAKLEDDFRAAVTVREQLRKKLTAVEEERANLSKQIEQLQAVVKERDDLRQQVAVRTSERDSAHNQLDQLRKGIKTLLSQLEPAGTTPPAPITSAAEAATPGKS